MCPCGQNAHHDGDCDCSCCRGECGIPHPEWCVCLDCTWTDDYPSNDEPPDGYLTDAEADADVLRNAGWGTDEDYGLFGDEFGDEPYNDGGF